MSFQIRIKQIRDVLTSIDDLKVAHYTFSGDSVPYVVWAEDTESGSVEGDNFKLEQAIQGTIDLFTKKDFDPLVDKIQDALKAAKISFYLNSVQFEEETKLIHYEWVWGV